jgi:hypothetical protein
VKTAFKFIVIGAIVLGLVSLVGLAAMTAVASSHDVEPTEFPEDAYIAGSRPSAKYADAYHGPMNYRVYRTIDEVIDKAFQKGLEVHRDENEVVYQGKAPGLVFHVSYILDRTTNPQTLTFVTTVSPHSRLGLVYWTVVRPLHRMIVPVMLDRMLQDAPL